MRWGIYEIKPAKPNPLKRKWLGDKINQYAEWVTIRHRFQLFYQYQGIRTPTPEGWKWYKMRITLWCLKFFSAFQFEIFYYSASKYLPTWVLRIYWIRDLLNLLLIKKLITSIWSHVVPSYTHVHFKTFYPLKTRKYMWFAIAPTNVSITFDTYSYLATSVLIATHHNDFLFAFFLKWSHILDSLSIQTFS